jgi:hypothetical protein
MKNDKLFYVVNYNEKQEIKKSKLSTNWDYIKR